MGICQPLQQSVSVLQVNRVVLDPRVERPLETVLPQILFGQHPEGLVVDVGLREPKRPQLRDRVHLALQIVDHLHELFVEDAQIV